MTTEILATFHGDEDNMTSFVFASDRGGFGVSVRDDDSGQFLPCSIHGIKTFEAAIAKAKELI